MLGVDLPFVEPELVRLLADWPGNASAVPLADGHRQVLCARYGEEAAPIPAKTQFASHEPICVT